MSQKGGILRGLEGRKEIDWMIYQASGPETPWETDQLKKNLPLLELVSYLNPSTLHHGKFMIQCPLRFFQRPSINISTIFVTFRRILGWFRLRKLDVIALLELGCRQNFCRTRSNCLVFFLSHCALHWPRILFADRSKFLDQKKKKWR